MQIGNEENPTEGYVGNENRPNGKSLKEAVLDSSNGCTDKAASINCARDQPKRGFFEKNFERKLKESPATDFRETATQKLGRCIVIKVPFLIEVTLRLAGQTTERCIAKEVPSGPSLIPIGTATSPQSKGTAYNGCPLCEDNLQKFVYNNCA